MTRLGQWIHQRQSYSNPLFGAMVILAGMLFPVFHASAAIEEPVQPMAQTADQVVDALNAVDAGISVENSFTEKDIPYRDFAALQRKVYESLFARSYTPEDADYYLDSELTILDEQSQVSGTTALGDDFDLYSSMLVEYNWQNDDELSVDIKQELSTIDLVWICFTGILSTNLASENVSGFVFQATRDNGFRVRWILILTEETQETIDNLAESNILDGFVAREQPADITTAENCEDAFAMANEDYNTAIQIANSELRGCKDHVNAIMAGGSAGCLGAGFVAAFFTAGTAAYLVWQGCMWTIIGAAITQLLICKSDYNTRMRNARIYRDAARARAIRIFGEENCPCEEV